MVGHGAKMQELYQERILELARASKHSKPIDNPTHRAEKNNAICGDKVIINATIRDNMVYDAHLIVRGCALCEAGAGIWKETAVGKELNELNLLRDELDNFLKNNESLSNKEFCDLKAQIIALPTRDPLPTSSTPTTYSLIKSRY